MPPITSLHPRITPLGSCQYFARQSSGPHGLVDAYLVDRVLGLGTNLFYNSPMEACMVIYRNNKPAQRRGHVIFIAAVNEVTRERSMSYLKPEHHERVADAYHAFTDVSEEKGEYANNGLKEAVKAWEESSERLQLTIDYLLKSLESRAILWDIIIP